MRLIDEVKMQHRDAGITVSPDHRGVNSSDVQSANDQKRRCRVIKKGERCKTFLSRYNHGDICHACEEQIVRGMEHKLAPAERSTTPKKKRGRKADPTAAKDASTQTASAPEVASPDANPVKCQERVAEPEVKTSATSVDSPHLSQPRVPSNDMKPDSPAPKSLRPEAATSP